VALARLGLAGLAGLTLLGQLALAQAQEGKAGAPAASPALRVDGAARTEPLTAGDAVPDFSATGLDGRRVAWTSVVGRPAVLVVWASWCPHCRKLVPLIARIAPEFSGVRVLTVTSALGRRPGPSPQDFMRTVRPSLPVAVDDGQNTLAHAFGVYRFPTVFWVRPDGTVAAVTEGELDAETVREYFRDLAISR
jgi:thiol-disulfide isomerase/thioredoxin